MALYELTIDDKQYTVEAEPSKPLLWVLREDLNCFWVWEFCFWNSGVFKNAQSMSSLSGRSEVIPGEHSGILESKVAFVMSPIADPLLLDEALLYL